MATPHSGMLRTGLAWFFTVLAVAISLLILALFAWDVSNETHVTDPDGSAAGYAFIAWIAISVPVVIAFLTFAAVSWNPAEKSSRDIRRFLLLVCIGASGIAATIAFRLTMEYTNGTTTSAFIGVFGLMLLGAAGLAFNSLVARRDVRASSQHNGG